MSSVAPGSSGATVISRRPSTSGSSVDCGTFAGCSRWAGVVGTAPNGREERSLEVEAQRLGAVSRGVRKPPADALGEGDQLSSGAVTAVGRNEVTPRRRSRLAMPSSASGSPIASWPPQPWTWRSTNPGA